MPMHPLPRLALAAAIVAGALAACHSPDRPCDVCTSSAIVYGRVTSTGGLVVVGTTVTAQLYREPCDDLPAPAQIVASVSVPADAHGDYRARVRTPRKPFAACVAVIGDPHGVFSDIGLNRAWGARVRLRADQLGHKPDSVRVDFHFAELP